MPMPDAEALLHGGGIWAYVVIAVVLLAEAVPVFGAFIPAQLFLLGAGFLANIRVLDVRLVVIVATLSLFIADVIAFWLGRRYGLSLLNRLPASFVPRAKKLSVSLAEHAGKTMIFGKFLGPARALTPPLAGAGGVKWPRFLAFEAAGAVIWVVVITGLGYVFGHSYERIEKYLGRGAVVLVLVAIVVYLAVMRFRTAKTDEKLARGGPP